MCESRESNETMQKWKSISVRRLHTYSESLTEWTGPRHVAVVHACAQVTGMPNLIQAMEICFSFYFSFHIMSVMPLWAYWCIKICPLFFTVPSLVMKRVFVFLFFPTERESSVQFERITIADSITDTLTQSRIGKREPGGNDRNICNNLAAKRRTHGPKEHK